MSGTGTVRPPPNISAELISLGRWSTVDGREEVGRAERLEKRSQEESARRGCERWGCRRRRPPQPGRGARAREATGPRPRPRPRTSSTSTKRPSRLTSGRRRRSGSSCSCFRVEPLGQMNPWLNTSSRSPRMRVTLSPSQGDLQPATRLTERAGPVGDTLGRLLVLDGHRRSPEIGCVRSSCQRSRA